MWLTSRLLSTAQFLLSLGWPLHGRTIARVTKEQMTNIFYFPNKTIMAEIGYFFLIIILVLIVMIILSAISIKGIHQWGCKHNWNAATFFLANLANNILFGIPGLIESYQMRNTTFVERN